MTNLIIFSVDSNVTPFELGYRHITAISLMKIKGITFSLLTGCYRGDIETSYAVADTPANRELIDGLCKQFDQECYLLVDTRRQAFFKYIGQTEPVFQGCFKSVSKHVANRYYDGYTKVAKTGQYYVIDSSLFTKRMV